jgi:hypothetical protein
MVKKNDIFLNGSAHLVQERVSMMQANEGLQKAVAKLFQNYPPSKVGEAGLRRGNPKGTRP